MPATNELLQEGRYRVSHSISQDGTVFEAYDTVRNTTVLVHEFPVRLNKVTTVSQQESVKLAFANQAKILSEIEHESLLHVHDYFSEIDRQFLVMEPIEGEELYELLKRNRRAFGVGDVLRWADELLDALDYLHSRKPPVIHRNIKPQNLRLHSSGKIKLLGVGLDGGLDGDFAPHADSTDLRYSPMEQIWPGLDAASQKVITHSYDDRSERILKEPLDARSDVYSLGATLYFLVTGQEPVDSLERSIDVLEGKLDPLREPIKVDSQIPAEISDVLMKALEIKRENRYDSAVIMRQVLKTAVSRWEEREAEDAHEHSEAAEILRRTAQSKTARSDHDAAGAEQRRAEELRQQQVREAEEERAAAEERAKTEREAAERAEASRLEAERAEAERLEAQRAEAERLEAERVEAERVEAERLAAERAEAEQQAAERAAAEKAEADRLAHEAEEEEREAVEDSTAPDADLLEIPVSAEVMAYRDGPTEVDEDELAAVLEELEKAEFGTAKVEHERAALDISQEPNFVEDDDEDEAEPVSEPVQVFDRPLDSAPEASSSAHTEVETDMFAETEKRSSSLPVPAIAGAIGLVVVIAVGAWFAMSGSSEPTPPPPVVQQQVVQPEPQPEPSPETLASTEVQPPETATADTTQPTDQSLAAAPKAAPTAKPKKAEAKNEPGKKKSVTVDDLINDN